MASPRRVMPNMNFSRYSSAVFVVAQEEVWRVFHWLFHHHHHDEPGVYVGQHLRKSSGGMSRIGAKERAALDRGEDPVNMDIPLLYRLLQHTCGLTRESPEFAWNNSQSEQQRRSLEHQLYLIKEKRNALCHDFVTFMHMTDKELNTNMQEMMTLLCDIVREAGQRSQQPATVIQEALANIKERLAHIQVSVPPSAILPQEFALLAKRELLEQWEGCTTQGNPLSPPLLQWVYGTGEVPLSQLLQGPGEEPPQVLVVLGETGAGKSSLCRQMLDAWLHNDQGLAEVAELELVVLVECRRVFTRDLTRLLVKELLPQTCRHCHPEEVLGLLKGLRVLWLVDGLEEAAADARGLLGCLVEQCSAGHVVLLTGQLDYQEEVAATLSRVASPCYVTHRGLTRHGFCEFLASLMRGMGEEGREELSREGGKEACEKVVQDQCNAFIQAVKALGPGLLEELHNPLKLMLAMQLWEEGRLGEAAGAPLTGLYAAIQEALVAKLVAKLRAKISLTEAETKDRVKRWVATVCEVALTMWARGCYVHLDAEAEQQLRDCAMNLLLPYIDCFSTFLGYQASLGPRYSFLHHTQQSTMAAQHLHSLLLQGHTAEKVEELLLPGKHTSTCLDQFLSILISTATSLAAHESLTEGRARVVARLLEQCSFCPWLEVVCYTSYCPALAQEVRLRIPDGWQVSDDTVKAAAVLSRIEAPASIDISLFDDPDSCPDLMPLLQCLGKTTAEVTLLVHHAFSFLGPPNPNDSLLHPLCNSDSSCHLINFTGVLTADGCHTLQHQRHNIMFLKMGLLDPKALQEVILLTYQVESLETLEIYLFNTFREFPSKSVAKGVPVVLSLLGVKDQEAESAVALARRISHKFERITLVGTVAPATVCRMVRAFRSERVRTPSLGKGIHVVVKNIDNINIFHQTLHIHYFPLPLPTNFSLIHVYKIWNADLSVQLTAKLTVHQRALGNTTSMDADHSVDEDVLTEMLANKLDLNQ